MVFSILVVDDEPGIRSLLKAVLEQQGYNVSEAGDGITGVEQCKILQPDIVLLDITMPGLDGMAVLHEVRRQNCSSGILMVSAIRANALIANALACGADGYLCKPFRLQILIEEVERVGALAHMRRSNLGCTHQAIAKVAHRYE